MYPKITKAEEVYTAMPWIRTLNPSPTSLHRYPLGQPVLTTPALNDLPAAHFRKSNKLSEF